MLVSSEGFKCYHALVFKLKASNNVAEYEAIIADLRLATSLRATKIPIRIDSHIVFE